MRTNGKIQIAAIMVLLLCSLLVPVFAHKQCLGDVNGDGKVDIIDVNIVAKAYGSKPGDPNWNPDADVNHDGIVDIGDLAIVGANFGKVCRHYYGYAENNYCGIQMFKTWVTACTVDRLFTVRWEGWPIVFLPLPAGFFMFQISAHDDKGWSTGHGGGVSGEYTFNGYPNTNTWLHVTTRWSYVGASWIINVDVSVHTYIGA